jgi:hypothetical protein
MTKISNYKNKPSWPGLTRPSPGASAASIDPDRILAEATQVSL